MIIVVAIAFLFTWSPFYFVVCFIVFVYLTYFCSVFAGRQDDHGGRHSRFGRLVIILLCCLLVFVYLTYFCLFFSGRQDDHGGRHSIFGRLVIILLC